jgi:phosphatidylserine/phosphatidylglycerophosphate/cardiolipin synthase-like enzyme
VFSHPRCPSPPSTSGAAVATGFAPEQNCIAFAVDAIDAAERQILVNAYALTTGSGIVETLVRAKQRGVDVMLIADRTTPCERGSGIDPLADAGVPIWIDRGVRIAHAKAMVIDDAVTLVGSMNWTASAARNSEDLNLVASQAVAAAYSAHWRNRQAASVPFTRRDDWCRRPEVADSIICNRDRTRRVSLSARENRRWVALLNRDSGLTHRCIP